MISRVDLGNKKKSIVAFFGLGNLSFGKSKKNVVVEKDNENKLMNAFFIQEMKNPLQVGSEVKQETEYVNPEPEILFLFENEESIDTLIKSLKKFRNDQFGEKYFCGKENTLHTINDLRDFCHSQSREAGWYDNPREDGTIIALIHSELSEALEGLRKDKQDEHLPHRKSVEVELADAIIRILDFAGFKGYDLSGAILEKLEYNRKREDHKKENRLKEGGKKF